MTNCNLKHIELDDNTPALIGTEFMADLLGFIRGTLKTFENLSIKPKLLDDGAIVFTSVSFDLNESELGLFSYRLIELVDKHQII